MLALRKPGISPFIHSDSATLFRMRGRAPASVLSQLLLMYSGAFIIAIETIVLISLSLALRFYLNGMAFVLTIHLRNISSMSTLT